MLSNDKNVSLIEKYVWVICLKDQLILFDVGSLLGYKFTIIVPDYVIFMS